MKRLLTLWIDESLHGQYGASIENGRTLASMPEYVADLLDVLSWCGTMLRVLTGDCREHDAPTCRHMSRVVELDVDRRDVGMYSVTLHRRGTNPVQTELSILEARPVILSRWLWDALSNSVHAHLETLAPPKPPEAAPPASPAHQVISQPEAPPTETHP